MKSKLKAEIPLESKTVFNGKLVRVRIDTVRLPDGGQASREVVEHRPAAVIVPIDAEENVIMVRQYRHPVGETLLEAPAGVVEEHETPQDCAQRELQEETGYLSRNLQGLGQFWMSPGFCDELMYVYVARDLVSSSLEPDADENILTETVPLRRVTELVRRGEIQDAKTIAALLMAICLFEQG